MLNLDWNILWNVVNILVLFLLLKIFLFKPVTKIMEERRKAIADSIQEAEAQKLAAAELQRQYEARLTDARLEADGIVKSAKEQASREAEKILRQARADAGAMLEDARKQTGAEREKAMRDIRGQAGGLALLAAAKLAQKNMDEEADLAFVNAFLSEAGGQQ